MVTLNLTCESLDKGLLRIQILTEVILNYLRIS